jgi:hypothetical protein
MNRDYTLIQSEILGNVVGPHDNRATVKTLAIAIEPPVQLNPEIVSKYVTKGTLSHDPEDSSEFAFESAFLVGSSEERTVIYARFTGKTAIEGSTIHSEGKRQLARRTLSLLEAIGVRTVQWDTESRITSSSLL